MSSHQDEVFSWEKTRLDGGHLSTKKRNELIVLLTLKRLKCI